MCVVCVLCTYMYVCTPCTLILLIEYSPLSPPSFVCSLARPAYMMHNSKPSRIFKTRCERSPKNSIFRLIPSRPVLGHQVRVLRARLRW